MDYSELVDTYVRLDETTKRLEKTFHIAKLLRHAEKKNVQMLILLLQGRLFPVWDDRKLGVASKLVIKAIGTASGNNSKKIIDEWKKKGDLGLVASKLMENKKQATLFSETLTVKKVFNTLRKIADLSGQGTVDTKTKLIAQLLSSANPDEARYITRTVLEDLRIGAGAGTLRDAIVWAYLPEVKGISNPDVRIERDENSKEIKIDSIDDFRKLLEKPDGLSKDDILIASDDKLQRQMYNMIVDMTRRAYDLTNDFGEVATKAMESSLKGLSELQIVVGKPLNLMLYLKAKDIEDGFNTVGRPAALEYKYDGFRIEAHRKGDKIQLFTRRLEDVTTQFPDVKKALSENVKSDDYILDMEVVGLDKKTGNYLPFQHISKRIRRKYDIAQIEKEIPVVVNIFDIIEADGHDLLDAAFKERRDKLNSIVEEKVGVIVLAKQIITDDTKTAEEFYREALDMGNEGIMMKNLDGIYKPGSRVGYGVKVKPVMETLDLVIVGAEWGEGKRSGWFTSFLVACIDEDGVYHELGKVGTGIKELEGSEGVTFNELTELLKPIVISENGKEVKVKPKVVIEVHYEEIQKSTNYDSGYALRFPRIIRLRSDRSADEISELDMVDELFHNQN